MLNYELYNKIQQRTNLVPIIAEGVFQKIAIEL